MVTGSLAAILRLGHSANNGKMAYLNVIFEWPGQFAFRHLFVFPTFSYSNVNFKSYEASGSISSISESSFF